MRQHALRTDPEQHIHCRADQAVISSLCSAWGRFNVYVTQPEVKPGCVLRRANIGLLEKKKLVTDKEVDATWLSPVVI